MLSVAPGPKVKAVLEMLWPSTAMKAVATSAASLRALVLLASPVLGATGHKTATSSLAVPVARPFAAKPVAEHLHGGVP